MGLLDQRNSTTDFVFSDFDSSFTPSKSSSPNRQGRSHEKSGSSASQFAPEPVRKTSKPSDVSLTGSTITTTSSSSTSQSASSRSAGSQRPHAERRSTYPTKAESKPQAPRRARSEGKAVFDLYGEDEQLQEAVPRIHFCEICFCACNIH